MKPGRGPKMKTGQGIPQTFQSPENQAGALLQNKQDPTKDPKKDPRDGDKLPSYKVKSTKSVNTPKVEGKTTTTYKKPTRTAEGDAAYAALTPAQRKAQDDKYKALNTKTTTTESRPAKTTTVDTSKTVTLGKETASQVEKRGKINTTNARDKREAIKNAAYTKAAADSTASSERDRKKFTRDGELALSKKRADWITKQANKKANLSLGRTVSFKERNDAFPLDGKSAGTRGGVFSEKDFQ